MAREWWLDGARETSTSFGIIDFPILFVAHYDNRSLSFQGIYQNLTGPLANKFSLPTRSVDARISFGEAQSRKDLIKLNPNPFARPSVRPSVHESESRPLGPDCTLPRSRAQLDIAWIMLRDNHPTSRFLIGDLSLEIAIHRSWTLAC